MALNQRLVSSHFPYLQLRLEVRDGVHNVEALVDTGFDGHVAMPAELVTSAEPPDGYEIWRLADGSEVLVPWYRGVASLGDVGPMSVVVIALGDEPLVGRALTDRFSLTLDHGRRVIVEP